MLFVADSSVCIKLMPLTVCINYTCTIQFTGNVVTWCTFYKYFCWVTWLLSDALK